VKLSEVLFALLLLFVLIAFWYMVYLVAVITVG